MNQYFDPNFAKVVQAHELADAGRSSNDWQNAAQMAGGPQEDDDDDEVEEGRGGNALPVWGNQNNMNLNPLVFTNITTSPYFKVTLIQYKTYHQVIDEIYYKVDHLEPWERGSRTNRNNTGMCGGVRGVGAGGIVSSAFCLLFKLFTLKLTRKQLVGILNHCDSPYIRGLGFMYIRYCQPPPDIWDWFVDYLDDEEEIDPKAGGGKSMTIGEMCLSMLTRLEWFDTRFPRIPVNVQKQINDNLAERKAALQGGHRGGGGGGYDEEGSSRDEGRSRSDRDRDRGRDRSRDRHRDRSRDRKKHRSRSRSGERKKIYPSNQPGEDSGPRKIYPTNQPGGEDSGPRKIYPTNKPPTRSRSRSRDKKDKKRDKHDRRRSRSRDRSRDRDRSRRERGGSDYADELKRYSDHKKKHKKDRHRSRSRSRSRDRRDRR